MSTYGDVTGGTVTFYARGKVIDTAKVPESGKVTLSTRFPGVRAGRFRTGAEFSGTATTFPTKTRTVKVKLTD